MREVKHMLGQMTKGYSPEKSVNLESPLKTDNDLSQSADFERAELFDETYDDDQMRDFIKK